MARALTPVLGSFAFGVETFGGGLVRGRQGRRFPGSFRVEVTSRTRLDLTRTEIRQRSLLSTSETQLIPR